MNGIAPPDAAAAPPCLPFAVSWATIKTKMTTPRPPRLHHCTSLPYRFFGREHELQVLDHAVHGAEPSVVAFIGPGGQGKTAIVQQCLERACSAADPPDGAFLWSFYRGKDADLCLRELLAYADGLPNPPDVSASYCVDSLLARLRRERWALVLDGVEVVQHDAGPWFGRLVHPELGRLIEELASVPMPGVLALTSRFAVPGLETRRHARIVTLGGLDPASACSLLSALGVRGSEAELHEAAASCGFHAKAVELLGTYLVRFKHGQAARQRDLPSVAAFEGASDEERKTARILAAFQAGLPPESQDILALATAFREPPTETRLLEYLASPSVHDLLHNTWSRDFTPFAERRFEWLTDQLRELVALRLLERVGHGVIDAHPLVRRGFEHRLGVAGRRQTAQSRAGFLRGRPDRRKPETLDQAREEVELFHAHCDAGLWNEADSAFVALDNPKHRFLAPAFERDLLLRFFPAGDWRQPPLWPGFGRYRSLAICFEMLGDFENALTAYREADAPLCGDALIALGRLDPLLTRPHVAPPWQTLWQAYRAHALCLAGRTEEGAALARTLVPVDIYEWVHVFECLLRTGRLASIDMKSVLFRSPHVAEHQFAALARRRLRADFLRLSPSPFADLRSEFEFLVDAYDRGGLPFERVLTRLSFARLLSDQQYLQQAEELLRQAAQLCARHGMRLWEADVCREQAHLAMALGQEAESQQFRQTADSIFTELSCTPPRRP